MDVAHLQLAQNKMAKQIVKEQLKLFTNQLQASARQWQQILELQLGDLCWTLFRSLPRSRFLQL